jgi:hypothetical protein
MRMCLMLAVSRVRRHHVEAVLMRDQISLINASGSDTVGCPGVFEGWIPIVSLSVVLDSIVFQPYVFFTEVRGAASNSAYYGYPELWISRYPAHRYHVVSSPGFEPTTLCVVESPTS